MNFARSETALDINCQPGPLQQINQVTHWLGMISHKISLITIFGHRNSNTKISSKKFISNSVHILSQNYIKSSLTHEDKSAHTELSKYFWKLKNTGLEPKIKWSIKKRAYTYIGGATHCDLCLTEKTVIALANPKCTLNSRTEILGKCRHQRKFTLQTM